MRILHITPTYSPVKGGIETLVKRVSETLVAWGHEVTVLTSDFTSVSGYFELGVERIPPKKTQINGVNVLRVPFGNRIYGGSSSTVPRLKWASIRNLIEFGVMNACSRQFSLDIRRHIFSLAPDVVMATPHLLPNVRAAVAAHKDRSFPFVLVPCLHEEGTAWPVDEMTQALSETDGVIAMTSYEASQLATRYGVHRSKINIGGFGVDIFTHSTRETVTRKPTVLFLGRKVLSKGIPFLLEAMKSVWERDPNIDLVLAGARSPETHVITSLIDRLPIECRSRVVSLDDITEEEKSQLLKSCLCLVLPSRIESFGGVILEAWAHKSPVITFDLPVFRSFVMGGVDGLLVSPHDSKEMANAILYLKHHREQASAMGHAGYEKARSLFSWEQVTRQYLITYNGVTCQPNQMLP